MAATSYMMEMREGMIDIRELTEQSECQRSLKANAAEVFVVVVVAVVVKSSAISGRLYVQEPAFVFSSTET